MKIMTACVYCNNYVEISGMYGDNLNVCYKMIMNNWCNSIRGELRSIERYIVIPTCLTRIYSSTNRVRENPISLPICLEGTLRQNQQG